MCRPVMGWFYLFSLGVCFPLESTVESAAGFEAAVMVFGE